MMKQNQTTPKLPRFFYFVGCILLFAQGCAKYKEFEAVFPPRDNSLAAYQKIVVVNKNRGNFLYDLMENALKAQLTSIYPGNVKAAKEIETIDTEINLFSYNPKIDSISEKKIAYLSFDLKANETIKRWQKTSKVPLRSCNYLKKKKPCRNSGSGTVAAGMQSVKITLTGSIKLTNGAGKSIIPISSIKESYSDSGKLVKTPSSLIFKSINQAAHNYAKRIIPHKRKVTAEILRGGDAVSIKLIENDAFNMAINRLDKTVTKKDDPDYEDLYNLGLSYEALNELRPALEYYQKADDLEPGNSTIKTALKRVKKIVKN